MASTSIEADERMTAVSPGKDVPLVNQGEWSTTQTRPL